MPEKQIGHSRNFSELEEYVNKYTYKVPIEKQVRLLVYTDCANEADDQYALAHALMTPKVDVVGIIAAHFNAVTQFPDTGIEPASTASLSYRKIERVLDKMNLTGQYPLAKGSELPMEAEDKPIDNEAVRMIIDEAMKSDDRPLFIGCQGAITDLASAILIKPEICDRMTAIWIGGAEYPQGGNEFNLMQDIKAANILFSSQMPLWQIPSNVYKTLSVSLAELQYKVEPCGDIGKYLFENMLKKNDQMRYFPEWPHGELWGLGDQGVLAVLMQEVQRTDNYKMIKAPYIREDMTYDLEEDNREIRVYDSVDVRLILEDFFCKLAINYR